jgi:uncharacterized membrane protein YedE/YeeE
VPGFLDVFGALSVAIVEFYGTRSLDKPLAGEAFFWPEAGPVDFRPVADSILFGLGRGMTSFCPGVSLVVLGLGQLPAAIFVASLFCGIAIGDKLAWRHEPAIRWTYDAKFRPAAHDQPRS